MRFSLQDVKKSVQRRGGEPVVSLHFLRPGELDAAIENVIAYHERMLGQAREHFSLDDVRVCIADYRLADCIIATLSRWYVWQQREWAEVLLEIAAGGTAPDLTDITSPAYLRLALYDYVNVHHQGFLDAQTRPVALQAFAASYRLGVDDLEYLLALDSDEEAYLARTTPEPPTAQEVVTLYNQWVFEAALFNASSARFVIDCAVFARTQLLGAANPTTRVEVGVGQVVKRLCYLARRLGVYYDLMYDPLLADQHTPAYLHLTLYGPQEVTGAPQQYGARLARLCRLLLGYSNAMNSRARSGSRTKFADAIVEAEAHIHFLQRSYAFKMDATLLQLLPSAEPLEKASGQGAASPLFDSSIEQSFSESFVALAKSRGVDGWQLEREPEPLLLEHSIFIPDFALTRGQRRVYVEILGFWTPAYRERKLQKLQQLQERDDLLLAIPVEARDAFAAIASSFPVVYYDGQLSVSDVLQVLHSYYDDFAERLAGIDVSSVRERVRREGLLPEHVCYTALRCYRRSELQRAATSVVDSEIAFVPGLGLYSSAWVAGTRSAFIAWMNAVQSAPLKEVAQKVRMLSSQLEDCGDTAIESLLAMWPEVQVRRNSIFEAVVEYIDRIERANDEHIAETGGLDTLVTPPIKETKKRAKRVTPMKRMVKEAVQEDLWT